MELSREDRLDSLLPSAMPFSTSVSIFASEGDTATELTALRRNALTWALSSDTLGDDITMVLYDSAMVSGSASDMMGWS